MNSSFLIGHYTNAAQGTGCTVILPPENNITSASVKGASPGTREIALLAPDKKISSVHAILLTGGSAFGLHAAQGIMEILHSRGIGYQTDYGIVPIVPAAVIFDKNVGDASAYPAIEEAKIALKNAKENNRISGNVGAGTGATVGKWRGLNYAMKGGLGVAHIISGKLEITALSVVNAVGDIYDRNHNIIAGAINEQDIFFADLKPFHETQKPKVGMAENTVLCAVMINAKISKTQAAYLAERVHFGISRRIEPSHTSYDGDVAFVISHPEIDYDLDLLASSMIDTVESSVINAVITAETAYGIRSYKEIFSK
ncbi:MAG: P1 family peptidase [Calditrichaceae bacterium]|nr:P1 family peptidase [Calditrichaceae bacterium]MBN2708652.1 P1 family peptidase [Calditrichaceae bacterium]